MNRTPQAAISRNTFSVFFLNFMPSIRPYWYFLDLKSF